MSICSVWSFSLVTEMAILFLFRRRHMVVVHDSNCCGQHNPNVYENPKGVHCFQFSKLVEQELLTFRSTCAQPGFWWGSCYSIFSFMCMFCRSFFVLFSSPCQRQCEHLPSLGVCCPSSNEAHAYMYARVTRLGVMIISCNRLHFFMLSVISQFLDSNFQPKFFNKFYMK
jgi:hypothetical protein